LNGTAFFAKRPNQPNGLPQLLTGVGILSDAHRRWQSCMSKRTYLTAKPDDPDQQVNVDERHD
jgi:hypothetical protein